MKCAKFADTLIRLSGDGHLDQDILRDIQVTDSPFIGHVETGNFPANAGVTHTFDRINRVFPDLTGGWKATTSGSCVGTSCDKTEKKIGMGYTRDSYSLHEKSYSTDLFCLDSIMTADRAQEQYAAMVENLRESSLIIVTDRLRVEGLGVAGKLWTASATLATFTATWNTAQTRLMVSALPTSILTAPMLMNRVQPLITKGYLGKSIPKTPPLLELITDSDTLYAAQVNSDVIDKWRYNEFATGAEMFYKYGWSGQIGNFAVRCDMFPMRFNKVSDTVLERVFPYKNIAATDGIKSVENEDYAKALYQISYIWHPRGMKTLGFQVRSINPSMPFMLRNYAGQWTWAMHDLGATADGCVIDNKRQNKGVWYADFMFATQAQYPEFIEAILHKRQPAVVTVVDVDVADPGYPEQTYSAEPEACPDVIEFTPTLNANGGYEIAANTITCNGVPIVHIALGENDSLTTLALLAAQLNTDVSILGTWDDVDDTITLADSPCDDVVIPFVA